MPRCGVDWIDGVRVVVVCRRERNCSKRDSRRTRALADVDVSLGLAGLLVDGLSIRVAMFLRIRFRRDEVDVLDERFWFGVGAILEGLVDVVGVCGVCGVCFCVGVRVIVGDRVEDRVVLPVLLLFKRVDTLELVPGERLRTTIRLRDEFPVDRLMLGDDVRVCVRIDDLCRDEIAGLRLLWVRDHDGLLARGLTVAERRETELRLLGVDRAVDRELDRLDAEELDCLLLCPLAWLRRLLLRELRRDDCASAAAASRKTTATAEVNTAAL